MPLLSLCTPACAYRPHIKATSVSRRSRLCKRAASALCKSCSTFSSSTSLAAAEQSLPQGGACAQLRVGSLRASRSPPISRSAPPLAAHFTLSFSLLYRPRPLSRRPAPPRPTSSHLALPRPCAPALPLSPVSAAPARLSFKSLCQSHQSPARALRTLCPTTQLSGHIAPLDIASSTRRRRSSPR
jgi:hypothetical protein